MQRETFERRLRELIPDISETALQNYFELVEDPEVQENMGTSGFYDTFYMELSLVKRDYGTEVARTLFDYGAHYTWNPFELRGAARRMAEGWTMGKIADRLLASWGEEDFCAYTPEEEAESQSMLWLFQNRGIDVTEWGALDHCGQELRRDQEMEQTMK